jgi:hypothetical protein
VQEKTTLASQQNVGRHHIYVPKGAHHDEGLAKKNSTIITLDMVDFPQSVPNIPLNGISLIPFMPKLDLDM